ncbi:MAG: DNA primase [bacterium]
MAYKKIPEEIIDLIRERVSIERVIGEYVPLKKSGHRFKGLCPFHQEKTPSFTVNTDLQIFKCFGCGESGNVFNFLMKYENISFLEAVQKLALSAGIEIPEMSLESPQDKSEKANVFEIMNKAWKLFANVLLTAENAENARQYLLRRGIQRKHIIQYGLGYAPDQWDFLVARFKSDPELLISSGLAIRQQETGKLYDRFRNRIMFPIREPQKGRIVAFGGRTLGDDPAKYINSPETIIYRKSQILYGLFESKKTIQSSRETIVVEGYFDRISMDIAGFNNVVAPCGTSITHDQIRLLKRFTDTCFILFDSDGAGIKAAQRALEIGLEMGLKTLAVPLPKGKDPDEILREQGKEKLERHLNNAISGIDFLIECASSIYDLDIPKGRRNVVETLIPFLLEVNDDIDRGAYIARIANLVGVPSEAILELLRRSRSRRDKADGVIAGNSSSSNQLLEGKSSTIDSLILVEKELFHFLIKNPEYLVWAENPIHPESMLSKTAQKIYESLKKEYGDNGNLAVDRIIGTLSNHKLQKIFIDLFEDSDSKPLLRHKTAAVLFQSLVWRLKEKTLLKELESVHREISSSPANPKKTEALLMRKLEILNELSSKSFLDQEDEQ